MGGFLNRDRQRQILEQLRECYPNPNHIHIKNDEEGHWLNVNIGYLAEHGLLVGKRTVMGGLSTWTVRITAKGLDFLQDDGGLGAILGVVTVKIHDDSIRDLLVARVNSDSTLSDSEKGVFKHAIKDMPVDVLKEVVKEAAQLGLKHVPDLLPWLTHAAKTAGHALGMG